MESLFIKGKARIIEDALTASLFDLLSVLGSNALVRAVFSSAERVNATGRTQGDHLDLGVRWDTFAVELWPSWPEGEPDAVIWLLAGGRRVNGLVVEAKFGASKSGDFEENTDDLRDQLARYARGLQRELGGDLGLGVVYLTPHNAPPSAELAGSWKAIDGKTGLTADTQLSWLSWIRVDEALGVGGYLVGPYCQRFDRGAVGAQGAIGAGPRWPPLIPRLGPDGASEARSAKSPHPAHLAPPGA